MPTPSLSGNGKVRVLAPAKINLALHVTGLREDGYHLLETLAVFTRFGDRLKLEAADKDRLTVTGPHAGTTPHGPDNIIMRAFQFYREATGITSPCVSITLEKNLPVSSGIGGGSSDAAAFLKAYDRVAGFAAGREGLEAIGRRLGADLPMCLCTMPLIARGIGEKVQPLEHFPPLALVLVNPRIELQTPAVFRALETKRNPVLPPLLPDFDHARVTSWLKSTRNDLEPPALTLFPQIAEARHILNDAGAEFVRMSGSGATFFGLFSNAEKAANAAAIIKAQRPGWFVIATETGKGGE